MGKVIRLTESDLNRIVRKVLNEQTSNQSSGRVSAIGSKGSTVSTIQKALKSFGFNLGTSGPNGDGIDGRYGGKTADAVKSYQRYVGVKQTGTVDSNLLNKMLSDQSKGWKAQKTTPSTSDKSQKKEDPTKTSTETKKLDLKSLKVSKQVKKQLAYMSQNNILSNDSFTIVDDRNNQVHSFNPGYQLVKTYYVIMGKDRGDELKTESFFDWLKSPKNWPTVYKTFGRTREINKNLPEKEKQRVFDNIKACYLGEWKILNTPSGVFKRAGNVSNYFNDTFLTWWFDDTYGKRYITWETCGGETIPFGFHGTKIEGRTKVLDVSDGKQSCSKRNMSMGCINFKESDIIEINKFIKSGQLSIWLPDMSEDIVEIPSNCLPGGQTKPGETNLDRYRQGRFYTHPGKI